MFIKIVYILKLYVLKNPRKTRCFPNSLNSMKLKIKPLQRVKSLIPGDVGLFLRMINCYKHALHKRPVYNYTNDPVGVVRTIHVIQPP